jgi:signal transduction histidine kinase/serine phosphatase RsbU (regulator of sigma subunit)
MSEETPDVALLQKQVAYYKKRLDDQAGRLLQSDYAVSGLQRDLLQKRQGFALLASLQHQVAGVKETSQVFRIVAESVNSELGMDRTVVFVPTEVEGEYRVALGLGFQAEVLQRFDALRIQFPREFADGSGLLVHNKGSETTPLVLELKDALELPFFLALPVMGDQGAIGILLTGRTKEVRPLFPPFDKNDIETFRAIAGLISATVKNVRVAVLQEMDRLKTEFFANISHEFRTPITLTLGPLESLLEGRFGEVSDVVRGQAEVMLRNQQRMLGLINQILDLAKLESGRMALRVTRVDDLNAFVGQVVAQFEDLAYKRGLELRTTLDARLADPEVELYADLEKLDRVLFNLLSNAHKFAKQGSIEVATEVTPSAVRLRVTDTGIGIREDQLPHIFDRFRQADGSASREYAGTGLGLALVAEIAKLHGGTVQVFSRYGHGSTFVVELPLGRAHLDPACIVEGGPSAPIPSAGTVLELNEGAGGVGDDTEALNAEVLAQRSNKRPTVLYVDDNRDLRHYIRGLLAPTYHVLLAVDGADGLAKAKAYKPDLVLSDLMMPKMTGTDFCAALRRDVELAATPFVLLTARSTIESKVEGLEDGADDYLSKPFSPAELLARVKNLITIREQHTALKRELLAAREIQRALLPPERQSLPGAALQILFRPCAELSGDFFDVVRADDEVVFYLADVTSHGTAAAQVTYLVREAVRASLAEARAAGALSPGALMARLRTRYAGYGLPLDVGIQLGRLDLRTRELSVVRANAPAALRIRGGRQEMLSGPVVSALSATPGQGPESAEEPCLTCRLDPGEQIFLFSDGAYEFDAGGRPFGMKRLVNLLAEQARGGEDQDGRWREEAWSRMRAAAKERPFQDDITVVRLSLDGGAA